MTADHAAPRALALVTDAELDEWDKDDKTYVFERMMFTLRAEWATVARLTAERDAANTHAEHGDALLRALVDDEDMLWPTGPISRRDSWVCVYCRRPEHAPDCVVAEARAWLAGRVKEGEGC